MSNCWNYSRNIEHNLVLCLNDEIKVSAPFLRICEIQKKIKVENKNRKTVSVKMTLS